jgi:hypothetical protein
MLACVYRYKMVSLALSEVKVEPINPGATRATKIVAKRTIGNAVEMRVPMPTMILVFLDTDIVAAIPSSDSGT